MGEEQLTDTATVSAFTIVDSSRISTFVISILLIVYGSFRSLNIERENKEREKENKEKNPNAPDNDAGEYYEMQTIDTCQALLLPVGASASLLIMFLFFDSLQLIFAIFTAILATVAFAFLLLPMCQYLIPCAGPQKISLGPCGRVTVAEIVSSSLSFMIVCVWIMTGHWLLMDALGMGLCVAFIALVRLPSLKVSTMLLVGLLIYDVFWVFFSSYIFSTNVMVKVATRPAENPVGIFAKKLHLTGLVRDVPKLSLPAKLVFPSSQSAGNFNMLGLGDIVMPGLLLCFVLRYDTYKKSQLTSAEAGVPPPPNYVQRLSYFHCSLMGYFLGLLTATVSSEVFRAAQPALLYLVPFTLLPLLTMAYLKGDLRRMWHEPFIQNTPAKHVDV
ncbi:Signal peptide peptidase-like 3 [Nucella lapillus]